MVQNSWSQPRLLVFLFFAALLGRLLVLVLLYTPDLARFETGDYALYTIGADHIAASGDFSNSLFLVRPFLYPLIVWLLGNIGSLVLAVNIVVGAFAAPLTFLLGLRLGLPRSMSIVAGVIAALDPGGIMTSTFLGPEPFANVLLAVACLGVLSLTPRMSLPQTSVAGLAVGGLIALSALIRPAAYLLWIPLGIWLLAGRRFAAALAMAVGCLIGIGGWVVHNSIVFQYPTFSTVSGYTMVYYRAVAVERLATGNTPDEVVLSINRRVEALLGRDPDAATMASMHGYLAATPAVSDALQKVALDVFRAHPREYLLTIPVGFARMYGMVPGQSNFVGWLGWVETVWNVLLVVVAAAGLLLLGIHRRWRVFWFVLLIAAYFTVGTLAVKSAGMTTRERSMLTPLMALTAAYAVGSRGPGLRESAPVVPSDPAAP